MAITWTMVHLRSWDHSSGFALSPSSHRTTYGDSAVPCPSYRSSTAFSGSDGAPASTLSSLSPSGFASEDAFAIGAPATSEIVPGASTSVGAAEPCGESAMTECGTCEVGGGRGWERILRAERRGGAARSASHVPGLPSPDRPVAEDELACEMFVQTRPSMLGLPMMASSDFQRGRRGGGSGQERGRVKKPGPSVKLWRSKRQHL